MNKKNGVVAVAIVGVAVLSWLQTGSSQSNARANTAKGEATIADQLAGMTRRGKGDAPAALTSAAPLPLALASGQASPFAAGEGANSAIPAVNPAAQPDKEVVPPEEAARRKKMEALGYMVPPGYYNKSLTTLREMARQGDAYALVHLGEKYYFELNGQKTNPDFDPAIDYPSAAKKSFSEALAVGNIRSAAIISELYLQENNMVDAYAWHILSKRLGDNISAEWFEKTTTYANLTEQQKQQGLAKVPDLVSNINSLSAKYKVKSVF